MALFSRVTVWVSNQVLTASALNGEFNNILNNAMASSWIGFSANVSQMQQQANPGGVGTESLAGSISDELQRLRWMFAYALGVTYWYDQTGRNLGAGNLAVQTADLGSKVVTAAKIADATITSAQIAPGVLVPVPQHYYSGSFALSSGNYWQQTVNMSMLPLLPIGTLPAPFGFFNVGGFGTPTIAASNHAGIAFTAPDTGIIEVTFQCAIEVNSAASTTLAAFELHETVGSTVVAYATVNPLGNAFEWVYISGYMSVTSGSSYNLEVRGTSNGGNVYIGFGQVPVVPQPSMVVKMHYVKGL